jgi:hypothetical protein
MTSKILVAAAALGLIATTALAQRHLQSARPGQMIQPLRIAKSELINGQVVQTGPWIDLGQVKSQALSAMWLGVWDDAEQASDGTPTGVRYGIDNSTFSGGAAEGSRWFFGPGVGETSEVANMTAKAGYAGLNGDLLGLQWFGDDYNGNGLVDSTYDVVIQIFTAEDFDGTGAGPAFSNPYTGVSLDFGMVPDDTMFYHYAGVIDLAAAGLANQIPMDGTGAVIALIGTVDGGGNFVPNTTGSAQFMLWGTEAAATFPATPGTHLDGQWEDDAPRDGTWTAGEFYSFAYGLSPDPLGLSVGWYNHVAVVEADTVTFTFAQNTSGGAAEAAEDDNLYVVAKRGFSPVLGVDVPQIDFIGGIADYAKVRTAGGGPGYSSGKVNVVAKADTSIYVRSYIKNTSNQFVMLDQTLVNPNTEFNKTFNLSGTIDNYMTTTGRVDVKVGGANAPTSLNKFWTISVDKVRSSFTASP